MVFYDWGWFNTRVPQFFRPYSKDGLVDPIPICWSNLEKERHGFD